MPPDRTPMTDRAVPREPTPEMLKQRAYGAVRRAIDRGVLVRPDQCGLCGSIPNRGPDGRSNIHAHHHLGYDRPLDVQWVCQTCHKYLDPRPARANNGRAILTEEAVERIRSSPGITTAFAEEFGVDRTTIQRVRRVETWKEHRYGQ